MATSRTSKTLGVIAEDTSDVDVIKVFFEKYAPANSFSVKKFVGNGCGKLHGKCRAWAENLFTAGCDHVFLFHDQDRHDLDRLRTSLRAKIPANDFPKTVVVIPVEEIEAWLLSDSEAIKAAFSLKKVPKRIKDVARVTNPKGHLSDLVRAAGNKTYVNTIHNKKIAEKVSLENLRRCKSYEDFDQYVLKNVFPPRVASKKVAQKRIVARN